MPEELDIQERVQQIIKENANSSIEVSKTIDLEVDVGNLIITDKNELNKEIFKNPLNIHWYLEDLGRDCVQHLLNKVWDLPNEISENKIYAILPSPSTRLPREKKIPKPKESTKWELFAKEKGIVPKKRAKKTWDETLRQWVPRYGMKKVQAEKEKNWVRDVPNSGDPYEDQFAKAAAAKKERVARNEFQRLRNIAKARKLKMPSTGVIEKDRKNKEEFNKAIDTVRVSTASLGKFQPRLPSEKPLKERGDKRKRSSNALTSDGLHAEKKMALEILDKVNKSKLNTERAVERQIAEENVEMSTKKKHKGRRSKMGGKQRSKSEQKGFKKGSRPQMGTKTKKRPSSAPRGGRGSSRGGRGSSRGGRGRSRGGKRGR